jgi:hypothetical protein
MSTLFLPQSHASVVRVPFVDLHAQYLNIKPEIDAAIAEVIADSACFRSRHVDAFERAWADTVGVKHLQGELIVAARSPHPKRPRNDRTRPPARPGRVLKRAAFLLLPLSVLFIKYFPEYGVDSTSGADDVVL